MKKDEIIERIMYNDGRIFNEMQKIKASDKSFTEKGLFGLTPIYSQQEVRDIYFNAIGYGMKIGIEIGSIKGQQIELYANANNRQKEFLDKFYKLADEYDCAISYHPVNGMQIIDLKK